MVYGRHYGHIPFTATYEFRRRNLYVCRLHGLYARVYLPAPPLPLTSLTYFPEKFRAIETRSLDKFHVVFVLFFWGAWLTSDHVRRDTFVRDDHALVT